MQKMTILLGKRIDITKNELRWNEIANNIQLFGSNKFALIEIVPK